MRFPRLFDCFGLGLGFGCEFTISALSLGLLLCFLGGRFLLFGSLESSLRFF